MRGMKVLQVLNGLNVGGAEAFLKNLRLCFHDDDNIQMDFLLRTDMNTPETLDFFRKTGSEFFIMPTFPPHYWKNRVETIRFIKNHFERYDVIHVHGNSLFYFVPIAAALKYAKETKIVVHSHSTSSCSKLGAVVHRLNKMRLMRRDCVRLACSKQAGQWMFGKAPFVVVNNAINLTRFQNSEAIRNQLRDKYKIDKKILICVGRLEDVKNHIFLIPVVKQLVQDLDVELWICGEGSLKETLQQTILENGLQEKIRLLGNRSDVPDLLKAADIYLMPSLYEGMSIAAIEAQATGIPCILSDVISDDLKKGGNVVKYPAHTDIWVKGIKDILAVGGFEYSNNKLLEKDGYGLSNLRKIMLNVYNGE